MSDYREYEEYKRLPQAVGWLLLVLLSASLIGYALWVHALVPDVDRQWDFGALPQAPAASIYSTRLTPAEKVPPQQLQPLPEARPLPSAARKRISHP